MEAEGNKIVHGIDCSKVSLASVASVPVAAAAAADAAAAGTTAARVEYNITG